MPRYICFFSYTSGATRAMINKSTDRVAAATGSAGAVTNVETHEVFAGEAQAEIMRTARTALAGYRPPTA